MQLQHVSPDGDRLATLDAAVPEIVITDAAGLESDRVPLGDLDGIGGLHWLASGRGFVVWTLDAVHVVGLDGDRDLAYAIERSDGPPLSIEDVRILPRGLLVVAQECAGGGLVGRHAAVVHLHAASVVGVTDLGPWSGGFLYAATPLLDGRIVLALNDHEHFEAAQQQCFRQMGAYRGGEELSQGEWACSQHIVPYRFYASEFRVLRVHARNVVEVQGNHACPVERGCSVANWAPSATEVVWTNSWKTYRLRSPLSPSPLMRTGGVWAEWSNREKWSRERVHSLWVEDGRILEASRGRVWTSDLAGTRLHEWTWPDAGPARVTPRPRSTADLSSFELPQRNEVFSARFTPDGTRAIVALGHRIVELDLETGDRKTVVRMLDVPAAFDPRNSGLHFADAKRLRSGMLAFDVVLIGEPRRSTVTVRPGHRHRACPDPFRNTPSELARDDPDGKVSDARYRELLPWVRARRIRWFPPRDPQG